MRKTKIANIRRQILKIERELAAAYNASQGKRRVQLGDAGDALVEARSSLYRLR